MSTPSSSLLWGFFSLHIIGGHILIPILLILSFVRKNVTRNYVFINFCITWILYSITFCFLLYAGEQTGPKPHWNICRTQAALVYAVPILVASASCALVFQLWLDIRAADSKTGTRAFFSMRNILLISLPYVLAAGYLIGPSIVAITARKTISRENGLFFCSSNLRALTVISATSVAIIFLITVTFEVLIARLLAQRARVENLGNWWKASGFFLRITLFTAYLLLSVAACGLEIAQPSNPVRIIIAACGPLVVFAVFGTNPALYTFSKPNSSTNSYASLRTSRSTDTKRNTAP
ncbi:hypothetical protein FRC19_011049 [Serendipita sp. 401]|nr:hypothetical protein FRC19_011049 [Serendipita sp. 401]KAG9057660.1 hypothetical protein FS842_004837 [Serendipita sp. 407]